MKKIICTLLLHSLFYDLKAQNISFSSNGHINNFIKVDTLFLNEFSGQKLPNLNATFDKTLNPSFLQFDSSFGFLTKNLSESSLIDSKLTGFKRLFTTSF